MPSPAEPDPRPLTGEPLAIDLLNTRWIDAAGRHDLLHSLEGTAVWLNTPLVREALDGTPVPADHDTRERLHQARAALDEAVANPAHPTPAAVTAVNDVLAHGRLRQVLHPDGPDAVVEVDAPAWLPAWAAIADFLRLLADRPERIRACGNSQCVLHFYDVSKNGTRRWCSMSGCGNRAKAQRHYARHRQD
ncbi:CGNR zinc finger domain-containing protein [Streptomyces sp. SLBN-134]|uniref:CGNR zinc finger domain-containing protein n=1 Tax=Streptomyces sp. SLBN-134 TaxID=2768456 RepID=UPI00115375EC|nr:CGNR zinc finger domain-containing protein [Streptomyces sp. SLBN-134]TQL18146.1 putative RNA-binding Zn ribbon-like protein [Streptomyces sp. SLBN-134]